MFLTQKEIAQDLFLTTTNKHYVAKTTPKVLPIIPQQEFKNPIAVSHEVYLELKRDEKKIEPPHEDADEYLLKIKERCAKCTEKYFTDPLDHTILRDAQILDGSSVYQVDYCQIGGNMKKKLLQRRRRGEKRVLPDGWIVPDTTTGTDFRNPTLYNPTCYSTPPLVILPQNNLVPEDEKLLNIKTGNTEYEDTHSRFGEIVIRKKLFGKMVRPEI